MSYAKDPRVVLTLDAGGTNFVFSAVQSDREVVEPITLPSNAHELQACLGTIVQGFSKVKEKASAAPAAISFAFPGPVDYPLGIIGDPGDLPAFKGGGIALGPMLEDRFVKGEVEEIEVPGSTRRVTYDPLERVGVGLSRLGTSKAVALGAYAFALTALDTKG